MAAAVEATLSQEILYLSSANSLTKTAQNAPTPKFRGGSKHFGAFRPPEGPTFLQTFDVQLVVTNCARLLIWVSSLLCGAF